MTRSDLRVRQAEPDDLPWIAELVRDSFDESLLPYLVAAQSGIVEWWRVVLEHPESFAATRFLVAVSGSEERLAYAELKELDATTGFLSYVAVDPGARGHGVATALLAAYLRDAPHLEAMELDVFADNASARRLYDRLGFVETARATWWAAPLEPGPQRPGAVTDLHAVLARHRTYGFTDLVADPRGSGVRFGILGREVLRCFTLETFDDPAAQATVRALFPGLTRRFAVLPGDVAPGVPAAEPLVHSLRLRSDRVVDIRERA